MPLRGALLLCLLALLLPASQGQSQRIECPKKTDKSAHFYAIADTAMEIAYSEEANVTVFDCSRRCRDDHGCMSYGYSKRLESCQLYDYDRETGPEFLVTTSDYIYYDTVDTKTSKPHYLGSCKHHRCENGAACRVDCSERGYFCECTEGYREEFCQTAYINEPRLVEEIISDRARDGVGFTFNNMHFLAISSLNTMDSSGNSAQADQVILRYDYTTEQYEPMQTLSGLGMGYFMDDFQLTGKQYLFICNYKAWGGTQDTDSFLWVYDNSSDSFTVHQTIATKGCLAPASVRSSDGGFYLFLAFYYAPSSYSQESPVFKWYPRYERFVEVETIATTGVFLPDMFEIEGTVYVGIPNNRDSSGGFTAAAEVWERSDSYDLYRGCYIDGTNRALDGETFSSDSMTVTMCITFCRDRGYPYAGLQAQSHCFCGDENYDEHGSASDCNQQCAGDSSEYCGASWRNSIYMTEPSWSQTQVFSDSPAPGPMNLHYYSHDGSHYLVATRHHDGSSCDHNTDVYVWNAGLKEFEDHQTIAIVDSCPIGVHIFERGGEKFMLSENARKFYSVTEADHWVVSCRVFRLVDTMWVDYTTVDGINVASFRTFERDGELYIFQSAGRNETNPYESYSECTNKIYKWV